MLEYDDERSGTFDPLWGVPDDKTVVLGMVTTKSGREETVDELVGRVHEAARQFPIGQLGVSPQCGFATSVIGNAISFDDQCRKLGVVAETAQALWSELELAH